MITLKRSMRKKGREVISKFPYIIVTSVIISLLLLGFILIKYVVWDADSLKVKFDLNNVKYFDEADENGSAKPYLWVAFFKIDGDTAVVNNQFKLQGTARVFGTPGNHGNLGDTDVKENDTFSIPSAIGKFETVLKPIPVKPIPGIAVGGVVGVIAVLMEEDSTPEDAAAKGHDELNRSLQDALNDLIPKLGWSKQDLTREDVEKIESEISSDIKSAIAGEVDFWDRMRSLISLDTNQDDRIGTVRFIFSHKELEDSAGRNISVKQPWNSDHGRWEINGSITVEKK
jgi:hypothetical protein